MFLVLYILVQQSKFPNNQFSMNNTDLDQKYRFQNRLEIKSSLVQSLLQEGIPIFLDTGYCFSKYFGNQFIQCYDFYICIHSCISYFIAFKGVYLNAEIVHSQAIWKRNNITKVFLEISLESANDYDFILRVKMMVPESFSLIRMLRHK